MRVSFSKEVLLTSSIFYSFLSLDMTHEIKVIAEDTKTVARKVVETPQLNETAKDDQGPVIIAVTKKNQKTRLVLMKSYLVIYQNLSVSQTLNRI